MPSRRGYAQLDEGLDKCDACRHQRLHHGRGQRIDSRDQHRQQRPDNQRKGGRLARGRCVGGGQSQRIGGDGRAVCQARKHNREERVTGSGRVTSSGLGGAARSHKRIQCSDDCISQDGIQQLSSRHTSHVTLVSMACLAGRAAAAAGESTLAASCGSRASDVAVRRESHNAKSVPTRSCVVPAAASAAHSDRHCCGRDVTIGSSSSSWWL